MIALRLKAAGLPGVKMGHDSFGVHPADVDLLRDSFRETMAEIYEGNVLDKFKQDKLFFLKRAELGCLDIFIEAGILEG